MNNTSAGFSTVPVSNKSSRRRAKSISYRSRQASIGRRQLCKFVPSKHHKDLKVMLSDINMLDSVIKYYYCIQRDVPVMKPDSRKARLKDNIVLKNDGDRSLFEVPFSVSSSRNSLEINDKETINKLLFVLLATLNNLLEENIYIFTDKIAKCLSDPVLRNDYINNIGNTSTPDYNFALS